MDEQETLAEGTLVSHLIELRQCCIRVLYALLIVFLCLVYFTDEIFGFVAAPLIAVLPEGSQIQAIGITASFMTPLKTVLYVSLMVAMPYVLYQVWRFVAPALYRRERRFAVPLLVSSIALFYVGVAFAYFVVFRVLFSFLLSAAPAFVSSAALEAADVTGLAEHLAGHGGEELRAARRRGELERLR